MPARLAATGPLPVSPHAVDLDVAGRRLKNARKNVEQRRLAGAVLAEQAMDAAGFDGHVDAVQGTHRSEALADPNQPQPVRGRIHVDPPPEEVLSSRGPACGPVPAHDHSVG